MATAGRHHPHHLVRISGRRFDIVCVGGEYHPEITMKVIRWIYLTVAFMLSLYSSLAAWSYAGLSGMTAMLSDLYGLAVGLLSLLIFWLLWQLFLRLYR